MFKEIVKEIQELHDKKNEDYSGGDSGYTNFNLNAELWNQESYIGPLVRASEKMIRVAQLQDKDPENESVEDSIKDIAILAIISLSIYREKYGKKNL